MYKKDRLQELKQEVYDANLELVKQGLVIYTWGNVSAINRDENYIVIKPSGVQYDTMQPDDMVVIDLTTHEFAGDLKPSSDTPTHIELYSKNPHIQSVVHTHSDWATSWAQSGRDLPCYGTTHADYFFGAVACTRSLNKNEVKEDYELNTGRVIVDTLKERQLEARAVPGILVANHGPFSWGKTPAEAVHNAKVLEVVCKMAYQTERINPNICPAPRYLVDKHYLRKHGKNAYYGQ